jgi:hypothetical protein
VLSPTDLAARSATGDLEIRPNALRIEWPLTDLHSSDARIFCGQFSCMARALESPVEQKMLRDTLLGSRAAVTVQDVSAHFATAIQTAAAKQSERNDANALFGDSGREDIQAAILNAAKSLAFVCGIELLPPFLLHLDCPALRHETEQNDRLRKAGELFSKFQSIKTASPDLSPSQILKSISPVDQPAMLRTILLNQSEGKEVPKLWAACGDVVYEIPSDPAEPPRTARISREPLRSICPGQKGEMLMGSRSGVRRVHADSEQPPIFYADGTVTSQTGFNAAAISSGRLWATHAEAGLVCWTLQDPKSPALQIKEPARNLALLPNGNPVFSSGSRIFTVPADGKPQPIGPESGAEVIGLFVYRPHLVCIWSDGQVRALSIDTLQPEQERKHPRPVGAAALLPWLDDFRILLAEESGPVACIGLEDEVTTQYSSPHIGCRMLAASPSCVAAVSADRQRLILWNSWEGRHASGEIHLGAIAKHRIADITFL